MRVQFDPLHACDPPRHAHWQLYGCVTPPVIPPPSGGFLFGRPCYTKEDMRNMSPPLPPEPEDD